MKYESRQFNERVSHSQHSILNPAKSLMGVGCLQSFVSRSLGTVFMSTPFCEVFVSFLLYLSYSKYTTYMVVCLFFSSF